MIYLFTVAVIAISQMAALADYNVEYKEDKDSKYKDYPDDYPLIPNVGHLFL